MMIRRRELVLGSAAAIGGAAFAGLAGFPAFSADKKPMIVKLPLEYSKSGFLIIGLRIDGKGPYRFMLDSGAFSACIKEGLAKDLALNRSGTIRTHSARGFEDSYLYVGNQCLLAGILPLPRITFVGLAKFMVEDIDGILPASFLTFMPSQLDFEAMELRYYLNGAPMDLSGFKEVAASIEADRADSKTAAKKIFLQASLADEKLVCKLDTGASSALLLFPQYVDKKTLWNRFSDYEDGDGRGANGETFRTRLAIAPDLVIGPYRYSEVKITLSDPAILNSYAGEQVDGLIGIRILRQFTMAITDKKTFWLKPNANYSPDKAEPLTRIVGTHQPVKP